ncbi:hypothetical protein L6Q96_03070 [Candidatus Binatia bacterium]|nr:hypothetical protein [Candidatus Binatia bacterium]
MERYEALVRLVDLVDDDAAGARRRLDERLRAGGFTRWEVIAVAREGSASIDRRLRRRLRPPQTAFVGGRLVTVAIVVWSLWLLWLLVG